jgi:glutamyl-tRNA synthetase
VIRVRFAPSPTGTLHIGNSLSAVANRNFGGTMLLRIDDTDPARNVPGGEEAILDDLRWLAVEWDEGPVRQSERQERYREAARDLPQRFEGVTLLRDDGTATYQLASVVDDGDFEITHVIRGADHRPNEPIHRALHAALGTKAPEYVHHGLVLGPDGKKLSKRHGATSVEEFREQGYIPEALVNFLALLGWSYDDKTTVMSRDELVERFTLERVGASPAVFDFQKLEWLNGVYLRALPPDEYADRLVAYLRERDTDWDASLVRATVPLVQEKIARLAEYQDFAGFFFHDVEPDAALADGPVLDDAEQVLTTVEPFAANSIEQSLRGLAERLELKPRDAFQPIRIAVTGSKVSPGLFESIELLGRERTLERIRRARGAGA